MAGKKKTDAQAAQPVHKMRTRNQGAASPPIKEAATKTRRGRSTSQNIKTTIPVAQPETLSTRQDPALTSKVKVAAGNDDVSTTITTAFSSKTITTQATSQEDVVAPFLQPSSRSQTPHLETESDSLARAPESRSTTPPARRATRSQTRSVSPGAAAQRPKKQPKKQREKLQRPRTKMVQDVSPEQMASNNPFSDLPKIKTKRGRDLLDSVFDESLTNDDLRSAKRTRLEQTPSVLREPYPDLLEPLASIAEDSSADDVMEKVQRPPRPSLNASRSSSRQPRVINTNVEDASAEDSSDNHTPKQSRVLKNPIPLMDKPLTPKPVASKSKSTVVDPISDDLEDRNKLYQDLFGRDMPVPQYSKGHPKYARFYKAEKNDDEEKEDENENGNEDDLSFVIDSPTRGSQSIRKSPLMPMAGPGSLRDIAKKGREELEVKKAQQVKDAKASRENNFKSFQVVFPATSTSPRRVLTDVRLLEPLSSFCTFAENNPTLQLPNAAEMKQLLTAFNAHSSAPQHEHQPRTPLKSLQPRQEPQPEAEVVTSNIQHSEQADAQESHGDVQVNPELEKSAPQQPDAQQSRGWFTGVASMLTSPIKFLGRRNQTADAVTTNGSAVNGSSTSEQSAWDNSFLAVPPAPSSTQNTTQRRRPARLDPANTPAAKERRRQAQTERKSRPSAPPPANVPQTARRVRFTNDDATTPIHARSVVTEERKKLIWTAQDEAGLGSSLQARARDMEFKRQTKRASMQVSIEDEDEHDANLSAQSARSGGKRKRRPQASYAQPDNSSSDEDSQMDSQTNEGGGGTHEYGESSHPRYHEAGPTKYGGGHYRTENKITDWTEIDKAFARSGIFPISRKEESQPSIKSFSNTYTSQVSPYDADAYEPARLANNMFDSSREFAASHGSLFDSGYDSNGVRKDRYEGTLFAQPPLVQANLEEGKHPLASRPGFWVPGVKMRVHDFDPTQPGCRRVQEAAQEPEPKQSATKVKSSKAKVTGTYGFSYSDDDESDEGEAAVEEIAVEDTSVLQTKTWSQTPPPKPKPSNAELPATAPTAEIVKTIAGFDKYRPVRPSGLRNVTAMSPLHPEMALATTSSQLELQVDMGDHNWDREVMKYLMAIPDENMIVTALPQYLYDEQVPFSGEVATEVMKLLG